MKRARRGSKRAKINAALRGSKKTRDVMLIALLLDMALSIIFFSIKILINTLACFIEMLMKIINWIISSIVKSAKWISTTAKKKV